MAISRFQDHRILSRPVRIHWAGWETDTLKLQQNGWELSAEEDIIHGHLRMIIRHEQIGMMGQTLTMRWDYERMVRDEFSQGGRDEFLQMRHMGRQIIVHEHGPMSFHAIDAEPRLDRTEIKDLADLAHFATPMVRTQAIVLPEATVDDLLAQILDKQKDAKTAYFKDLVAEEGKLIPPHKFHAQIISLAA